MQYFEKRYYDNRIGRFTTEDPVFWEVGLTGRPGQYYTDPQQWNSYSYVRNNPINYTDPSGEMAGAIMVNGVKVAVGAVVLYQGVKYRAEIREGVGTLVRVSSEVVVDVVISTSTAMPNWYTNTYSPFMAGVGSYVYDKVHGDEEGTENTDSSNSQVSASSGSPSPGNGGGKKDGGKKDSTNSKPGSTPSNPISTNEALTKMEEFLGKGYKDMGNGRFKSADGMRQARMGNSDITGGHGGGPHINLETFGKNGRDIIENVHLYIK